MSGLEVVKLIHYGRCNDVYISQDSTGRRFAVKRFYRQELENRKEYVNENGKLVRKNWFADFKRALDIQLAVDHESCIKCHAVYGIDFTGDDPVVEDEIELVFDFAECGCLIELENFEDPIPEFPKGVVKCIARDVLQALNYLSTINVAHRDVKPNNIFMNKDGRCQLGDFGESDFMSEDGKVRGSRGSYYFLAPEVFQLDEDGKDGNAIDVWALGITLWILYFGRFPFSGNKSIYETMEEIKVFEFDERLESLRSELREVDRGGFEVEEEFVDLLGKILERDPSRRIKPKEALEHSWLADVDYEVARAYSSTCTNNLL